ncbi:Hypothetical protein, putative [Bodo saltans]|uniref:Uncharacterized protein n=1 Tax=Bodo saltans TaxID=75058 RepID=A0A0S4J2F7_BODSA|nr:Hypothetical protein, putative [Bodo saltans]|eukprot:CUG84753.1 Hypothetical protein, putative [Bodo saltans]
MCNVTTSPPLLTAFAGIFPVMSYLHVPAKMSRPLWLMMGTCFLVDTSDIPTTSWAKKSPFVFLTSSHTFLPWQWMPDPSALKIPEDYRKARYITGRLMMADTSSGRAVATHTYTVSPLRFHPTLDVCALSMSGAESDAFRTLLKQRQQEKYFTLSPTDAAQGTSIVVSGYRGIGRLGELDTLDASVLSKLSKEDQASLLAELQNVEGKQEFNACGLRVARKGVAVTTHGLCYNGMSGAPAQLSSLNATSGLGGDGGMERRGVCDGVLYGYAHQHEKEDAYPAEERGYIGYVPSTAILDWLREG